MEASDDAAGVVGFSYEIGHLKRLPRTGWQLAGIRDGESVAEHSYRVAVLAYLIASLEGANAEHAAVLGLFHDVPETRVGDVPSVGKPYVSTADAHEVIADQAAVLPDELAAHIVALVDEHESAKRPDASTEARCSRDADKLDCLLQAKEYASEGYGQVQPWIDSMIEAVTTASGKRLCAAASEVEPSVWWQEFATNFNKLKRRPRE